jgi:hypothetical protein
VRVRTYNIFQFSQDFRHHFHPIAVVILEPVSKPRADHPLLPIVPSGKGKWDTF